MQLKGVSQCKLRRFYAGEFDEIVKCNYVTEMLSKVVTYCEQLDSHAIILE